MAGHEHCEHSGEPLIVAARAAFTGTGEQWTDMREDVYTALADYRRPVSAYDLAEAVSARRAKRVAPNSVYRILDLFVRTNLAHKVETANAYIANSHPGCRHDCIFLICDKCGRIIHADNEQLTGPLVQSAMDAGFADVRPVVEMRGICPDCL